MAELVGLGRTAEVFALGEEHVLKLFFDWMPADPVEHEFHATRLAYDAGVPVPQPYEIVVQDGRKGIVFERVQGESMLRIMSSRPWRLGSLIREFVDLQAAYSAKSGSGLPSLKADLARKIRRVMETAGDPRTFEAVLRKLDALPEGDCLCHMDFHPDNVVQTQRGWVILDWMNACKGDPVADLARTSLMLNIGGPPPGTKNAGVIRLGGWLAYRAYQKAMWAKRRGLTHGTFDAWLLPIAAARMAEDIPGERAKLEAIIRGLIQ